MNRIQWIDSTRGVAMLCLIFIHYIGALETRGFIDNETLCLLQSFLRIATPYFILIYGFTFGIVYFRKIKTFDSVKMLYKKLISRLVLVLLGRDVIVLISSVRYPDVDLWNVLTYQSFSCTGEILTFYFLAILCSPIVIFYLNKLSNKVAFIITSIVYAISFSIGSTFGSSIDSLWYRLFFYDVYAFFPFFSLVVVAMLLARIYQQCEDDKERIRLFFTVSSVSIVSAIIILQFTTPTPIISLSEATLKKPPHIAYLLLYTGLTIAVTSIVAVLINKSIMPSPIKALLSIIGRNSLLSYVLHYTLFTVTPISIFIFGEKNSIYELLVFIILISSLFYVIYLRDKIRMEKPKLSNKVKARGFNLEVHND